MLGTMGAALLAGRCEPSRAAIIDEDVASSVFDAISQSVVTVADFRVEKDGREVAEGVGSGMVWDSYGHVITNYHCVAKLAQDRSGSQVTRIGVYSPGSTSPTFLNARLVATDPVQDLAVLLVEEGAAAVVPARFGTSGDLRVGQAVYAVGNPYGLSRTLSVGVVSGLNRAIPSPAGLRIPGVIQTDAAISSGNSGGPLLDSSGRVVGMNTATFTRAGTVRIPHLQASAAVLLST